MLDYEADIEKLLGRETKEEAGIEIDKKLLYVNSVAFIRPDEIPVLLVKFAARYKSGEVQLEQGAFTDYVWVNTEEVKNYNCIKGITEEIAATIRFFKKAH